MLLLKEAPCIKTCLAEIFCWEESHGDIITLVPNRRLLQGPGQIEIVTLHVHLSL